MPKLIRDEFSDEPNRRRRYMLRRMAAGGCKFCARPAFRPGSDVCEYHRGRRAASARKITAAGKKPLDELV